MSKLYTNTVPHLFIAQCSRGPQWGCRPQAAQAPGFGGVGWLQWGPGHGTVRQSMGGGVRQSVVVGGHCHGSPLSMPGWGEGVRRELWKQNNNYTMNNSANNRTVTANLQYLINTPKMETRNEHLSKKTSPQIPHD